VPIRCTRCGREASERGAFLHSRGTPPNPVVVLEPWGHLDTAEWDLEDDEEEEEVKATASSVLGLRERGPISRKAPNCVP